MQLLVKNLKKNPSLHKKIRYLIVGGTTFLFYFIFLYFLKELIGLNYVAAIFFSYALTIILHFLLNRNFTFKLKSKITSNQIFKYFLIAFINYLLQVATLFFLYDVLNLYFYFSWTINGLQMDVLPLFIFISKC